MSVISSFFPPSMSNPPGSALLSNRTPVTTGDDKASASGAGINPQQKLLESLASHIPGMDAQGLQELDPAEYTPDKIAGRISGFVAMGLANAQERGRSGEDLQSLYDSAVKGVEKGFREAREILSSLDVLNGKVAEQVDETEELTFDALAGLNPGAAQEAQSLGTTRALSGAERFQHAERMELSICTRDGDEITIRFAHALDERASFASAMDAEGNQFSQFGFSSIEKSGLQISFKGGSLSAEEDQALSNLLDDVGQLANDFFDGDVQAAFEQAQDISFDSSQLARMELNMRSSTRYSAAQRYQETQQLSDTTDTKPGRRLGHLMREMQERFSQPGLAFLEDSRRSGAQLMNGMVEQDSRFKLAETEQQVLYRQRLSQLLDMVAPNRPGTSAPDAPASPSLAPASESD